MQSLSELSAAGVVWVPTPTVDEVAQQFKAHGRVRRVICSFKVREDSDERANQTQRGRPLSFRHQLALLTG